MTLDYWLATGLSVSSKVSVVDSRAATVVPRPPRASPASTKEDARKTSVGSETSRESPSMERSVEGQSRGVKSACVEVVNP
ncbi:Consortin [Manis pentadactyla]|nr:Consortin [Manis pentadactyla]